MQVRYSLLSPMTKTLLRKGTFDLTQFSRSTGGISRPAEVIIRSNHIGGGGREYYVIKSSRRSISLTQQKSIAVCSKMYIN